MIWVDYVIICIIVFSALASLIYGFVREGLSLVTWGCAFFIANRYYICLAMCFTRFEEKMVRNGIAIILLFIVTLIVGAVVNYVVSTLVERAGLSGTDRVLGVFFGALRGILIVSAALFFLETFTSFSHSWYWRQSQLIPQFNIIIRLFLDYLQSTLSFLPKQ
ncbi:MAG: CvpA family protein [Sodalis sp. (in: enterobacteria)]